MHLRQSVLEINYLQDTPPIMSTLYHIGQSGRTAAIDFPILVARVSTTPNHDLEKLHKSQECHSTAALTLQDFFQECGQILSRPQEPHGKPSKSAPQISALAKGPIKACKQASYMFNKHKKLFASLLRTSPNLQKFNNGIIP